MQNSDQLFWQYYPQRGVELSKTRLQSQNIINGFYLDMLEQDMFSYSC